MNSYKKSREEKFSSLPNLGVPMTLLCVNTNNFTFCCLGHSDLISHFKNLNTSSTSLTLSENHKPKHTLSTLSSKHDSMCPRKICIGQKIITENPEFTW